MTDPIQLKIQLADVIIKGLALIGTGVFFGYKTISGFNNQNMSLSLECERFRSGAEGRDLIIPTIKIEKGVTAALTLEALEVRFKWGDSAYMSKVVRVEIGRLKVGTSAKSRLPELVWSEPDLLRPHLYIAPGEKTSFACVEEIPRTAICHIDVVAIGRRRRSSFQAQWRASAVVPQGAAEENRADATANPGHQADG